MLEHHEIILLARLLGQHQNSDGGENNPLYRLADKLLAYVDRTEGELFNLEPLPITPSHDHPYGDRVMFHWSK